MLVGASDRSLYSRAFLAGIEMNPLMPRVICVSEESADCSKLKGNFSANSGIQFFPMSRLMIRSEMPTEAFGLVFVDRYAPNETEIIQVLGKAKAILVWDIDTQPGNTIAHGLRDEKYRVSHDQIWKTHHSVGFTRLQRDLRLLHEAGRKAELLVAPSN
jgi:hypothetical protein